jgi:hypothetical protein
MNLLKLLIAPLQAVVLFFAPHAGAHKLHSPPKPSNTRLPAHATAAVPGHPQSQIGTGPAPKAAALRATNPRHPSTVATQPIHRVRVVRNVDSSLPPDRAGRMSVSGRFADVCAELDRLVAIELRTA